MTDSIQLTGRDLAFHLADIGDEAAAIAILSEHLSDNGGDIEAHAKLGCLYQLADRLDAALEHFTIAAFNTPGGGAPLALARQMLAGPPRLRIYPILTALRTGTWWNTYFFHLYHRHVIGDPSPPTHIETRQFFDYSQSLQGLMCIGHSVCPGFTRQTFPISEAWDAIKFSIPGYNYAHAAVETLIEFFDVATYANPGIVFLYRNPLDHFVSMWEQGAGRPDIAETARLLREGNLGSELTPYEFAKHYGAEGYAKLVSSYFAMAERYPGRILLQRFEDITQEPEAYFRRVFAFFAIPIDEAAFAFALAGSSKETLLAMELKTGKSIAGQTGQRHISDGPPEKWRKHFSDDQIADLDIFFAKVGLSIRDLRPY